MRTVCRHARQGAGRLIQQGFNFSPGIRVEDKDDSRVDPGGAQQFQAILLGLGHGAFVGPYDALGVVGDFAQSHKSLAGDRGPTGKGKVLIVGIDAGLIVLQEDRLIHPSIQQGLGPGISIRGGGILTGLRVHDKMSDVKRDAAGETARPGSP